ncbi:MAG: hypothetical protein CL609_19580 [Anaerolineaceae bacterium]|nr:hypothetical protein [Anaerolineaceae bacterium]
MLNWFKYFQLEKISFFIGLFTGTILWFVLLYVKKWIPSIGNFIKSSIRLIRQQQLSGILISVKKYALQKAQTNHLASSLFSHEEIGIKPKLIAIKQDFRIDKENIFVSEIENLIPFTPDTPYLSRNYQVPEISLADALQKNASLIITGMAGIGKTFTLADLVISICLQKHDAGLLLNKTPIYFDIQDVNESLINDLENTQKIHKILFDVLIKKISTNNKSRLERFIQSELNDNNAILIIDGFDLLSKKEFDIYKLFLQQIIEEYKDVQIVITASTYWADLEEHQFIPLAVKPFSNVDIENLYRIWTNNWNSLILKSENDLSPEQVVLLNWVSKYKHPLTKLEYTLLIWGALEGSLRGTNTLSLYENFFIKLLGNKFNREKIGELTHSFVEKEANLIKSPPLTTNPILESLINVGIIGSSESNNIYFKHPDLLGYLASFYPFEPAVQKTITELFSWSIYASYFGFRISREANSSWADPWIIDDSPPLYQNILLIGTWLRHTSSKSTFRLNLIKKLISLIQNNTIAPHIRLRFLSIFAFANDSSGSLFLKQMLNNVNDQMKILAALSAAVFSPDNKIIPDLINALNTNNNYLQKCLCLALTSFDNELALHTLGKMLLSGEESIRKLIAENMAAIPGEGHEILKDAMTMDDILVRRSALFGLIRINEPWAFEIIEKTSIEDSQWVVRNVAAQALESFQKEENKPIPEKNPPYYDDPWLIEYASTKKQGLSPDYPPNSIILEALKDENITNKLNALTFVSRYFDDSYFPELFQSVLSKNKEASELAASTLYQLICAGKKIPSPLQYGLF